MLLTRSSPTDDRLWGRPALDFFLAAWFVPIVGLPGIFSLIFLGMSFFIPGDGTYHPWGTALVYVLLHAACAIPLSWVAQCGCVLFGLRRERAR